MMTNERTLGARKWAIGGLAGAGLLLGMAPGMAVAGPHSVTGNIGVYSKYILRGITESPENDGAAVQGGLDYAHDSGLYAGWWASSLGYTYDEDDPIGDGSFADPDVSDGFENDFYAGYAPTFGDFGVDIGVIQYAYVSVDESNLTEAVLGVSYKNAYLRAQYLLNDGFWGNAGDTYWYGGIDCDLPKGFALNTELGWYTYDDDDEDNDQFDPGTTTTDSAFRYLAFTLSHPIGDTGADMGVSYIVGGEDRSENDQGNTMVLSLSYGFDVM